MVFGSNTCHVFLQNGRMEVFASSCQKSKVARQNVHKELLTGLMVSLDVKCCAMETNGAIIHLAIISLMTASVEGSFSVFSLSRE